jgi:peptidoglycan/xylan/chitin deacetylase (PgdA/CDA1 family)
MTTFPHKKYRHHYKRWQRNILLSSPFVIFCGIIACIFFLYRFVLVVAPIALLNEGTASVGANSNIVCGEEEGSEPADPKPILSASYQQRVRDQAALSANLVANPDLTETNPASGQPVGFTHSIERKSARYSRRQDTGSNILYLRTATSTATPTGSVPAAWLLNPIAIQPERTYAYSFAYRSDVPVNISAEYMVGNKTSYKEVMTMNPSSSWQQFTAHFTNSPAATKFRMDISTTAKGYVDTRGFDIHEIASSELKKGIVSVAFDDGWQSIDDRAVPLLDKYDIRTTQYIISDVAAHTVPGYMSYDTIKKLHDKGNEIGSHTLTHCDQTLLDTKAITNNAVKSKQMLQDKKLGPITSFAYPLGQYNSTTQGIYEKEFPLIRSSDFGYNDRYFDKTDIHSIGIVNTTSDQEFQSWLDYTKKHKVWVVLVYHKMDGTGTYNTTSAQLDSQLQMVKKSGLDIKPLGQAAASIR